MYNKFKTNLDNVKQKDKREILKLLVDDIIIKKENNRDTLRYSV